MNPWLIIFITVCLSLFIRFLLSLPFPSRSNQSVNISSMYRLPPGPLPIIGTLLWLGTSFSKLGSVLRSFHAKYGPIITLPIGHFPAIFITDRSLAHQALIQNGAVFSDRPKGIATAKIINSHHHTIGSSGYGATWRALRRNLTYGILHPTRMKSFSGTRKWVLEALIQQLRSHSESMNNNSIKLMDHLLHAIFCLLVFMCFGEKINDKQIEDIKRIQRRSLSSKFLLLNFWPRLSRLLFYKRWQEFIGIWREQVDVMVPLIRARKKVKEERLRNVRDEETVVSYVDTLLEMEWPEEKRKLDEYEIVTLCSEFLNAGTDTTATALEWIMANLVKHPKIQESIVEEIKSVMGGNNTEEKKVVNEECLNKLRYLKAVILEGLRRHPPTPVVVPHAVTNDVVLNGYLVPKNGAVNFMVATVGRDPKVWEDPVEFKPERFLNSEDFDITGTKEIKMMPFGVGRRMCPGNNLAILHMEYFVANLVWNFEWKASNGENIDFSEKQEFTTVMKNSLRVFVSPRF